MGQFSVLRVGIVMGIDHRRYCDGQTRRQFLQIGGLAMGGLALPDLLRAEEVAGVGSSHKSVIMVYLSGGLSHHDTFDLKPNAPAEIRGEFKPISTRISGLDVGELLPRMASCSDKWSVVRSLVGQRDEHSSFHSLTGWPILFKARFTGNITTTDEGTYTFYVTADDGIRLWVNNQLLVDSWINQGATEYQATINLSACTDYQVKIEYYENGGDAVCKFEWSGPLTDRQVVPAQQLNTKEEATTKELFAVYPNPANDFITIVSKDNFKQGDEVLIYDMLGKN